MSASLKSAPLYFEWVLYHVRHLKTRSDAEAYFCWKEEVTPPVCICGRRKRFLTITRGYASECGARACVTERVRPKMRRPKTPTLTRPRESKPYS